MQFPVLLGRQTVLFQHIGRVAAVDILVVPGAEIGEGRVIGTLYSQFELLRRCALYA